MNESVASRASFELCAAVPRAASGRVVRLAPRGAVLLAGLLLVLGAVEEAHAAQRCGNALISQIATPTGNVTHGYQELRFGIANSSSSDPCVVTLQVPEQSYGGGAGVRQVSRTVRIPPNRSAHVSLWLPPLPVHGTGARAIVDGKAHSMSLAMPSGGHYRHSGHSLPLTILASPDRHTESMRLRTPHSSGRPVSPTPGEVNISRAETDSRLWSTHWLSYSGFDAIMITAKEFNQLSPRARSALLQYVECGGVLDVLGNLPPPPDHVGVSTSTEDDVRTWHIGFGVYRTRPEDKPVSDARKRVFMDEVSRTSRPHERFYSPKRLGKAFDMEELMELPVVGMYALLFVFGIVVGPVNLVALARTRRRIWLLWTVPLLSALACAAILTYAVAAEGWAAKSFQRSLTLLDQRNQRATSLSLRLYYMPTNPKDGLRFHRDTEVTPVTQNTRRYRNMEAAVSSPVLDWTTDQHLASGWVQPRIPAAFRLRKCEPRRERLEISKAADGRIQVINGLGVRMEHLAYAAPDGTLHHGDGIPAGAERVLTPSGDSVRTGAAPPPLRNAYLSTEWTESLCPPTEEFPSRLLPGAYMARLASNPFLEEAADRCTALESTATVYGITGGAQ